MAWKLLPLSHHSQQQAVVGDPHNDPTRSEGRPVLQSVFRFLGIAMLRMGPKLKSDLYLVNVLLHPVVVTINAVSPYV